MKSKNHIWDVVGKKGSPLEAPDGRSYVAGWHTRERARRYKKDAEDSDNDIGEENGPFSIVKYVPSK